MAKAPDTITRMDQIVDIAVERMADVYWQLVQAVFLEEPVAELLDELASFFARSLAVADLAARDATIREIQADAEANGVEFHYDDPALIVVPQSALFAVPGDMDRILGEPLQEVAATFADAVPDISQKIIQVALESGSEARLVWAQESVMILQNLTPVIQQAMTTVTDALPDGSQELGIRDFFNRAEARLARSEFRDITRARLENIYRTNISTAVNRAAWREKQQEPLLRMTPFYEYLATDDYRVRPHHWAFDGFIAPTDWPGWAAIWPPNGYQCRCSPPVSIFRAEARRRRLVDDQGQPIEARYKQTWRRAISAGLLTQTGTLTGQQVTLKDRRGRNITDTFPQTGFAGTSTGAAA